MRDLDTIDAELRLLTAVHWSMQEEEVRHREANEDEYATEEEE